jgi:glutamate-ammonia-ligase adenylyltransferase
MAGITSRTTSIPASTARFLHELDELLGQPLATDSRFVDLLMATPDPHGAALGLLRVVEAAGSESQRVLHAVRAGTADELAEDELNRPLLARLLAVMGTSEAMVDHLVRNPDSLPLLLVPDPYLLISTPEASAAALRAELLRAVGADPDAAAPRAELVGDEGMRVLRRTYRDAVMRLVADDVGAEAPEEIVDHVMAVLSDLAAAALDAALAIARAELDGAGDIRLAVIALGKTGARELNYVSDVDVVFVLDSAADEDCRHLATELAQRMRSILSDAGAEPALWEVDTALRPEGKAGALVRTLSEFEHYYADIAQNWEFQALLKARPVAGDAEVGEQFSQSLLPLVWQAAGRSGFIDGIRSMRRRVVDLIPAAEAPRQIKLGRGGLRDVEFSAQMLQLVHGRTDEDIRTPNTLLALEELGEHGYIGQQDAAVFSTAYRFMRVVEHRVQIPRMMRNALIPDDDAKLRILARSVFRSGSRTGPPSSRPQWESTALWSMPTNADRACRPPPTDCRPSATVTRRARWATSRH